MHRIHRLDIRAGQIWLWWYGHLLAMNQRFQEVRPTTRIGNVMISAVVFDAFGTLVNLQSKRHPFRQLLKEGAVGGRRAGPDDVRVLMSNPWSLGDAADQLVDRIEEPTNCPELAKLY